MPEGHTLHRLALDHTADFAGRPVGVSSPQGRFAAAAAELDGRVLERVTAHGKHLFHEFEGGRIVHVHLGLYGAFTRFPLPPPEPRPTVRLRLLGDEVGTDLIGATACELVDPAGKEAIEARLGPDPIKPRQDPDRAWRRLQRMRTTIGQALMDQSVLAGVGNVYRAEVLFVHGIHPEQPANTVTHEQWLSMWATLQRWLRQGVKDNVIITVAPRELGRRRSTLRKGEALHVYKMDACRRCGTPVRRWDLGGRWAYACETCQPRSA